MDFFTSCNTAEQAKDTYRKLAKCFHPDKGGDSNLMVELQRQYDVFQLGGRSHLHTAQSPYPSFNDRIFAAESFLAERRQFDLERSQLYNRINELEKYLSQVTQAQMLESREYYNYKKQAEGNLANLREKIESLNALNAEQSDLLIEQERQLKCYEIVLKDFHEGKFDKKHGRFKAWLIALIEKI